VTRALAAAATGLCVALIGCQTPAAAPGSSGLIRGLRFAPIVPDEVDRAAADLAAHALVSDSVDTARALGRLEGIEALRRGAGEPPTRILPVATDVLNATLFEDRRYRDATDALLERRDLALATRTRLEDSQRDDPLALADARIRDAWMIEFARAFNAISEPLGHSLMTSQVAPYRLASSLLWYALQWAKQEPLPLQRRQALAHWKNFVDLYPDDPEAQEVEDRIERAEERWIRTHRDRELERARRALAAKRPNEALVYTDRALRYTPDDEESQELDARARHAVARNEEQLAASLRFAVPPGGRLVPRGTRALAIALLDPNGDIEAAAGSIPSSSPLADEALFARAMAVGESGDDAAMWETFHILADRDPSECSMARHAQAAIADPLRNPYETFRHARNRDRLAQALTVLLGPYRDERIERSWTWLGEFALKAPRIAQTVMAAPLRLLQLPWTPPPATSNFTAVQARRYLAMHPYGEHAEEVRSWLEGHEKALGNYLAALTVAEKRLDVDRVDVEELRERAAQQALEVASHERRRDLRQAMLYRVAREFPETRAGRDAGDQAREEVETATIHRVRISRDFLRANPQVAGPAGLGVEPALLDGDTTNGELHPTGVVLVGGTELEFNYLDPSGDEDEPARKIYEQVSEERLGRLVSQLEEASFRNALLDPEDGVRPDPQRDLLFEKARLGLADDVDTRAAAEARFAYTTLRERYGMVRARKPILPFDLVVQGSIEDFSIGAFPRMRMPEKTPDSVLYQ
jgi:hypothetical protein